MASLIWKAKEESKEESTVTIVPNWLDLPREVTAKILHMLGAIKILTSAPLVCSLWSDICKDPLIWRSIDMSNIDTLYLDSYNLEDMCRHAIDLSFGNLVEINVEIFATNDLLHYIANSTSHLRRIRLSCCEAISDQGLMEVAKKLPLLEELDISHCNLSKDSLMAIGQYCPLLKSLNFNVKAHLRDLSVACDEEAFAIAKTMPKLQHLQLLGNNLTDIGVQAILDGCPLLESLSLRTCFNVDLQGRMGIKQFRPSKFYSDLYGGWRSQITFSLS